MTDAPQPQQALDYLAAITAGLQAAVLLDDDGNVLAGDAALAPRAEAEDVSIERAGGYVLALRTAARPPGLRELRHHDMRSALGLLAPAPPADAAAER